MNGLKRKSRVGGIGGEWEEISSADESKEGEKYRFSFFSRHNSLNCRANPSHILLISMSSLREYKSDVSTFQTHVQSKIMVVFILLCILSQLIIRYPVLALTLLEPAASRIWAFTTHFLPRLGPAYSWISENARASGSQTIDWENEDINMNIP